ncbi:uncharacterized protein LOC134786410 [Penaeus indicus]|uniref:uncharacterized protein LOC134786410 n=1 Tax=Penaeus indicus TaxID=29960 RepID=UPI00300C6DA7
MSHWLVILKTKPNNNFSKISSSKILEYFWKRHEHKEYESERESCLIYYQIDDPSLELLNSPFSTPLHEVLSLFLVSLPSSTSSSSLDFYISVPTSTSVRNTNTNPMCPSQPSTPISSASITIISRETLMMSWNESAQSNDKHKIYKRMKEKQD